MRRITIAITMLLAATAATTAAANETIDDLYGLDKPAHELRVDEADLPDVLTRSATLRGEEALEVVDATYTAEYVPLPYDD